MSEDTKKKITVDEINFDDLSGGTEIQERTDILPTTDSVIPTLFAPDLPISADNPVSTKKISEIFTKDITMLPIPLDNGKWNMKLMEEVTGKEFLLWIKNICPFPDSMLPTEVQCDKLAIRNKYFANIVAFHRQTLENNLKAHGIELKTLKH